MKVSDLFSNEKEFTDKNIAIEGHIKIYKNQPNIMYLVDDASLSNNDGENKIKLMSETLFLESSHLLDFEEFWDKALRASSSNIKIEDASDAYSKLLGERREENLEFFKKTRTLDILEAYLTQAYTTYNKYYQLYGARLYSKKVEGVNSLVYTNRISISGKLLEPKKNNNDIIEFYNWSTTKLISERFILYVGITDLKDVPMSIDETIALTKNQAVDDGYVRLSCILAGHLVPTQIDPVLYLVPDMAHIHINWLQERGVKINSTWFYDEVLATQGPARARNRNTHANPIHVVGKIKKSTDSPYQFEISDIKEVAIMTLRGVFYLWNEKS